MKLIDCEVFIVGNPPPGFGGRYFIFVKLVTDNGLVGYGEVYAATFSPHVIKSMVLDVFQRQLLNEDPFQIENFWRRSYSQGFTQRPDVSLGSIVSGLEIAMWDIIGKAVEKPVYQLLGGKVQDRLRSYTYLYPEENDDPESFYADPYRSAEVAVKSVAQGFTAVKFDPAGKYTVYDPHQPSRGDIKRSADFARLIREAVGDKADLLFGTHGQFSISGAVRLAKVLEQYDPLWFEEPTPPDMPENMGLVAHKTSIPIATGERLTSKYEFARVLQTGAASILQLNLGRSGGLLEGKKIASMAEIHYAQIAPHLYCGPIVGAANIQLAACSPNFLILESIQDWKGFHGKLLKKSVRWEEGYVIPSDEPGIGVELNEDVARAHPYSENDLHLDMAKFPHPSDTTRWEKANRADI